MKTRNLKQWTTFPALQIAALSICVASQQIGSLQADDDEIVVLPAVGNPADRNDMEINFDQQFFPGSTTAAAGRQRLETQIKLHLVEIDRACQLTDAQRELGRLHARKRKDVLGPLGAQHLVDGDVPPAG